jgi:hypothetical protein
MGGFIGGRSAPPPARVEPRAAVAVTPRAAVGAPTGEEEVKRTRRRGKKGQAQNILTTPYGTVGAAPTVRKTLLGE